MSPPMVTTELALCMRLLLYCCIGPARFQETLATAAEVMWLEEAFCGMPTAWRCRALRVKIYQNNTVLGTYGVPGI